MDLKQALLQHPRNASILFDETAHAYWYQMERRFDGVTGLISKYKKPFDKEAAAMGVARRDKRSVQDVLQDWEDNLNQASEYGKHHHGILDRWVQGQDMTEEEMLICDKVSELLKQNGLNIVASEFVVYDESVGRASPIDLVCERDGKLVVVDYKTNAKGIAFDGYKNAQMLYPFHILPDANYYHYSIQIGIYIKWLRELYGLPVDEEGYILHLRPPQFSIYPTIDVQPQITKLYEEKAIFVQG